MSSEPYLLRLANRLAAGLEGLDAERRGRHREFILGFQQPDGGFPGREGDSDLYYTGFAVRGLVLLDGRLSPEVRDRVAEFLAGHDLERLHVVDLVSWLYAAVMVQLAGGAALIGDDAGELDRLAERLESVRTDDGGYAKSTEGAKGSTYQSFLTALTYELIGRSVPRPNALVQFLYDRQRDDGGFVEIAPMRRSGTNPTAAAVALLNTFGGMDDEIREDVAEFLREVRGDEGGFQANTRIPFADGLSTFTAVLTALDLDLRDLVDAPRILRWLTDPQHGLELPGGGFRGAAWDDQGDLEYTFYGLGLLGLLGTRS